jgi:nitroreductase
MNVSEAIKGRRSIRIFKKQDVPDKTIEALIDAARWAPSAGNVQAWEFVIVRKQTVKKKLAKAARAQALVEEAPVIIVVCADEKRSSTGMGFEAKPCTAYRTRLLPLKTFS